MNNLGSFCNKLFALQKLGWRCIANFTFLSDRLFFTKFPLLPWSTRLISFWHIYSTFNIGCLSARKNFAWNVPDLLPSNFVLIEFFSIPFDIIIAYRAFLDAQCIDHISPFCIDIFSCSKVCIVKIFNDPFLFRLFGMRDFLFDYLLVNKTLETQLLEPYSLGRWMVSDLIVLKMRVFDLHFLWIVVFLSNNSWGFLLNKSIISLLSIELFARSFGSFELIFQNFVRIWLLKEIRMLCLWVSSGHLVKLFSGCENIHA